MSITATAPIWLWNSEKGSWHFLTIKEEAAAEIRLLSLGIRGGFGSVRVLVRIGETQWRTSVFPDKESGGYVLPLKASVRAAEDLTAGQVVEVELEVL